MKVVLKKVEKYICQINLQASMILNLVNDLLDLAKIEAFKFKLDEDYFNLKTTIQQSVDVMKPAMEAKQLKSEIIY